MNSSEHGLYNPFFSHIYVEKEVMDHPVSAKIISRFPQAVIVEIDHYKDVFNRSHQNYRLQKQAPGLILARKQNHLVYEGAPVCQSFGNRHFYYTSSVMNCIYDCEYCYLQGMYPCANLVVFVNLDEIMEEVKLLLNQHPVYLCISYDTDLLAVEHVLGYVKEWMDFAAAQPELTIEIRTKCADQSLFEQLKPGQNVIFAWTLSPEKVIDSFEHHTPSLQNRLDCIRAAAAAGFPVRLCFDPLLCFTGWEQEYDAMLRKVFDTLRAEDILDVSIGVFRISQDYLKKMRNQANDSKIAHYPYINENGVYHYGRELTERMTAFVYERIREQLPVNKIFVWKLV